MNDCAVAITKALKTLIESSAFLDELNAVSIDNGVTELPALAAVYRTDKKLLSELPSCEIAVRSASPFGESDAQQYTTRVFVIFTLVGDDEERLTDWVHCYVLALRRLTYRVLLDVGEVAVAMRPGTEDYSGINSGGPHAPFLKGGSIEVVVPTVA